MSGTSGRSMLAYAASSWPRSRVGSALGVSKTSFMLVGAEQALLHRDGAQAWVAAATRSAFHAQGKSRSSSCALIWPATMRSSTSVSHACGSTPFNFAVATRLATIAQWRAPPSDPANRLVFRNRRLTLAITHICGVQEWACAERLGREALSSTETYRSGLALYPGLPGQPRGSV